VFKRLLVHFIIALGITCAAVAPAAQPCDPDLTPEVRALLNLLESTYGKKTLAGISGERNAESILKVCGKEPAIVSFDLSGWNSPAWGKSYNKVVQDSLDKAKVWSRKGGIVAMQLHWKNPGRPDGRAWVGASGGKPGTGPYNIAAAIKPGTTEHQQVMDDLKRHADFLQQMLDARIPILWRPLHEIEGGWFWWTDKEQPENTTALWRMMFDYFVKERKLHNLIWVYSSALRCGKGAEGLANLDMRKRFYPGDAYVDIVGIDIYPNSSIGIGKPQEDTYAKSHAVMKQLAPGKMIALSECEAMPDPQRMMTQGPRWLYCLPWWGEGKRHPADWIKKTYVHEFVITLDQLPDLKTTGGNTDL